MDERTYLLKEIELQYNYRLEDGETYSKPKHLINDLFKSIKGSVSCEFGGFEQIGYTESEVKQLIKHYIDNVSI